MALTNNVQNVSIVITATRSEAIGTGKVVSENRQFTITDFYTEEQLMQLVSTLTPTA